MADRQPVSLLCAPFQEGGRGSHALLYRAAARYSGLDPGRLGPLAFGPWGKPFFSLQPRLHVSLSHSGSWWICALSPQPVGLDLQLHRAASSPAALSRRFFHPREDAFLAEGEHRNFFDLWCAKESYVKFTGQGFYLDPSEFSVVSPQGQFPHRPDACLRLLPFAPEYSLCLCALRPARVSLASM